MIGFWALALCGLYLLLLFGVLTVVQLRQTGTTGWVKSIGQMPAERAANLLFLVSLGLDLAGPTLVLGGALTPFGPIDVPMLHAFGLALFALAIVGAVVARTTMGASWRTGIDPAAQTSLVTHGPFAVVRNPVYTTMIVASLAVAALVPTVLALASVMTCVLALEVHTRLVEEPYLAQVHGRRYDKYASRVGRFVPLVGRRRYGG